MYFIFKGSQIRRARLSYIRTFQSLIFRTVIYFMYSECEIHTAVAVANSYYSTMKRLILDLHHQTVPNCGAIVIMCLHVNL